MPSSKNAFRRYLIIDSLLRRKNYFTSLKQLAERCVVSIATIKNDLSWMKLSPWNCPIEYSAKHKGYYYTEPTFYLPAIQLSIDDKNALKVIEAFLHPYKSLGVYSQFKKLVSEIDSFSELSFENKNISIIVSEINGANENLDLILKAISSIKKVSFDYINEWTEKSNRRTIHPYLIKEINNNLFVVGFDESYGAWRTFFIEKMKNLYILNEYFIKKDFDEKEFYKYSLGIFSNDKMKAQKLILRCNNYLLPQIERDFKQVQLKVKRKTEENSLIEISIIINEELDELLLSYSVYVEVIKPDWYRKKIITLLKSILKNYKP